VTNFGLGDEFEAALETNFGLGDEFEAVPVTKNRQSIGGPLQKVEAILLLPLP
jgi:hypothetical protein